MMGREANILHNPSCFLGIVRRALCCWAKAVRLPQQEQSEEQEQQQGISMYPPPRKRRNGRKQPSRYQYGVAGVGGRAADCKAHAITVYSRPTLPAGRTATYCRAPPGVVAAGRTARWRSSGRRKPLARPYRQ